MPNILDTIADYARLRVHADMESCPLEQIREQAFSLGSGSGAVFREALSLPGLSFICEVKKASPSKGLISEDFPYLEIARDYEAAGAAAISCLTEPKWFLGSDAIFQEIHSAVTTPILRKDYTVSDYQIYQSRTLGASAVLLIVALHDEATLVHRLALCQELGLSALVETHDEEEIRIALGAGAKILGVNNRNLKDFSVDFQQAARLRNLIPSNVIYVAESGVKSLEDIRLVRDIGADAVLMGEVLMRATDRKALLREMREAAES